MSGSASGTGTADQGSNPHYPKLTDDHHRELAEESGIADDVIAERGYETIWRDNRGEDKLKRLKIGRKHRTPKTKRLPGMLVPLYRPTGEPISVQFKPRVPHVDENGRGQKYVSPYDRAAVVDVHPRHAKFMTDPTVELWITEGVKKADCLASHGVVAAAISGIYNWRNRHGTLGDWEDIQLKSRKVVVCFDSDAATNSDIAKAMARLGNWLKNKGVKSVGYLVVPQGAAGGKTGVDDYLTWFGTLNELRDAITTAPPKPHDTGDTFTDARLAETIAGDILDGRYRYTVGLGWLQWDRRRWDPVPDERLIEDVRRYALERFAKAVKANNEGGRKGWAAVCTASRMRTLIGLAAGIPGVFTDERALDSDPDLLNTPAGVVDLRDGTVIPHDPSSLMTKITSGSYRPGAEHADWKQALEAVPSETRDWFQARMGQAITGHADYPRVGLLRGGGENGKSAVVGTGIMRAIGDYATIASPGVLGRVKDGDPSPARMALRGARIVLVEEMTEGRALDVTALKQIQDVDQITARYLYSDDVTFDATHTLFITSNYLPVVNETDHGTWRRVERIEFPYRFVREGEQQTKMDRAGDGGLKGRLRGDDDGQHDAIVTWLVEGAIAAHSDPDALQQPKRIRRDTNRWRMQADRVLGFWTERLVPDNDAVILKDELYVAFSRWLALGGHNAWAKELFHPRFAEHVTTRQHGVSESRPRELKELQASDPPAELTDRPTIAGALVRGDLPKRPRVYTGVRFRTDDDPHDDDEQPADQRKHDPVQGGPGQKESPAGPKESEDFGFGSDHPGPPSGGYTWSPPGWTKATKLDSCTVCRHSTVERLDGRPLHRRCAAAL